MPQPEQLQFWPDIPGPETKRPDCPAWLLAQANGIALPLPGQTVQTVVFSPPYWALRRYAGEQQAFTWPPISYDMPGGTITLPGDPACDHDWTTVTRPPRRGSIGDKSTLGGGQSHQVASRLISPNQAKAGDTARRSQSQATDFCRRCGAIRCALGLEPEPDMYVGHLLLILRELRRVLRPDGTVWLNLGFSYAATGGNGLYKGKDLVPIPWLLAIAAQYDGWWLRSPIVWSKANAMPSSVRDRLSQDYEHVLLLAPSARYYYDREPLREPLQGQYAQRRPDRGLRAEPRPDGHPTGRNKRTTWDAITETARLVDDMVAAGYDLVHALRWAMGQSTDDVVSENDALWRINTQPYKGTHYATYPLALPVRAIQAGTPPAVCAQCNRPYRRITKRSIATNKAGDDPTIKQVEIMKMNNESLGWRPDCACFDHPFAPGPDTDPHDPHPVCAACGQPHTVPAIVLDVTAGSGTTLQAARLLGRRGIGFDLAGTYLRDHAQARIAQAAEIDCPAPNWQMALPDNEAMSGDCAKILPRLPRASVDLLFLDPPFNLGKKYGKQVNDSRSEAEYARLLHHWLELPVPLLKPTGSLVLYHIPSWAFRAAAWLEELGLHFRGWITRQVEGGNGINRKDTLGAEHYAFLWFSRSPDATFNKVRLPHRRCARCGDLATDWGGKEKHRNRAGKWASDVWVDLPIPRGNTKTRPANELPLEAILRWVLMLTNPGDYVFDPFLGSGTTAAACELAGRRWGGIEIETDNLPLIRLKSLTARGAAIHFAADMPAERRAELALALMRLCGSHFDQPPQTIPDRTLLEAGRYAFHQEVNQ